jgi:putative ATPase
MGYGRGYRYAHDFEDGIVAQENLPENLRGAIYYQPTDRGFERELGNRLRQIREIYARPVATSNEGTPE